MKMTVDCDIQLKKLIIFQLHVLFIISVYHVIFIFDNQLFIS